MLPKLAEEQLLANDSVWLNIRIHIGSMQAHLLVYPHLIFIGFLKVYRPLVSSLTTPEYILYGMYKYKYIKLQHEHPRGVSAMCYSP